MQILPESAKEGTIATGQHLPNCGQGYKRGGEVGKVAGVSRILTEA